MTAIKIFRETSKPVILEPKSIYLVKDPSQSDSFTICATDSFNNWLELKSNDSRQTGVDVVSNISARNALTAHKGLECYVLNASDDPTVDSGAAKYIYTGSEWAKIAEAESQDLVLSSQQILTAIGFTKQQITDAVNQTHSHVNKTTLDGISESIQGELLFKGKKVGGAPEYASEEW